MPILIHNNHGISSSARPITNWLDNIISDGLYREKRKKCVIIGTLRSGYSTFYMCQGEHSRLAKASLCDTGTEGRKHIIIIVIIISTLGWM